MKIIKRVENWVERVESGPKGLRKITKSKNAFWFFCPGCKEFHQINDTWNINLDTNTITPSVLVTIGQNNSVCHSFITNCKIQFLSDCKHELAGQTVDLPEIDEKEFYKLFE